MCAQAKAEQVHLAWEPSEKLCQGGISVGELERVRYMLDGASRRKEMVSIFDTN